MTDENITHEVSIQDGYTHWAKQYNQDANALIVVEEQLALPLLDGLAATRVLDLGAGTGRYAIRFAARGAQILAIDQSEAMLAIARQTAETAGVQIEFVQQPLEMPIPVTAESFDLVVSALVFCHIPNLALLVAETWRVLRPGGHILVTDFHPAAIAAGWRTQFTNESGTFLLPTSLHTPEHYLTILQQAGFQVQTVLEALVRDTPPSSFPADVLARDGELPFCLVILASKPI